MVNSAYAGSGTGPTVSDEFAKKFATEKDTPYLRWVRGEGLEVISAQYVANLRTVELKPWPRRGASGCRCLHRAPGRRGRLPDCCRTGAGCA